MGGIKRLKNSIIESKKFDMIAITIITAIIISKVIFVLILHNCQMGGIRIVTNVLFYVTTILGVYFTTEGKKSVFTVGFIGAFFDTVMVFLCAV